MSNTIDVAPGAVSRNPVGEYKQEQRPILSYATGHVELIVTQHRGNEGDQRNDWQSTTNLYQSSTS